jgi:hypothetical protein
VSTAPTARIEPLYAGSARPAATPPSLPAEATTTMPFRQATSAAYDSGSSSADCVLSVPNDRLSTRMFSPPVARFCTTQSMAAMSCETSTAPRASPTLMLTRRASGAMP